MSVAGTRRLVALAAGLEAITGLALVLAPGVVATLLIGSELAGAGVAVGRVAGIGLMALGLACWPSRDLTAPLRGLLAYNLPVAVYLGYLGLSGVGNGFLLWPAFVAHATLALLLTSATRVEYRRRVAR